MLFPASAVITLGVLGELGVPPVIQWQIGVTTFATVGMSIFSIFENRYYLLFAQDSWWRYARYPVMVFNYTLAFTCFLPSLLNVPDQKLAIQALEIKYPSIPVSIYSSRMFVLTLDHSTQRLTLVSVMLSVVLETFSISFLLFWKMKKSVKKLTLSTKAYEIQKTFLKAVIIQIATPFLILIVPGIYFSFSMLSSYYNQTVNNFCVVLISFHGFISIVVMVLIHTPYRSFVISKLPIIPKYWRKPMIISVQSTR